nr:MAG TPA: DnaJ-like protein [Caudoviricetes sp.]
MSCSVCYGHPGCPCCQPEPNMIRCPECNGVGSIFYDIDGERITQEQFDKLSESERDKERCPECDGEGEIEYEYEPDYDSMPGGPDDY